MLHIGYNNPQLQYVLNNKPLKLVERQKDLGVTVSMDLKWKAHISGIVKKTNSIVYLINKSFIEISTDMCIQIYKTYVRPLLEHAMVVWNPYLGYTKLSSSLRNKPYEDGLRILNL